MSTEITWIEGHCEIDRHRVERLAIVTDGSTSIRVCVECACEVVGEFASSVLKFGATKEKEKSHERKPATRKKGGRRNR